MRDCLIIGCTGQVGGALVEALGADRVFGTSRTGEAPPALGAQGGDSAGRGAAPRRLESADPCAPSASHTVARLDLEELAKNPELAEPLFAEPRTWVFIAAGWTWVDGCEDDPDKARRVNRDAPAVLAAMARASGAQTVYYSTEYVFDGMGGPYDEDDEPSPLGVYAESKLEGEQAVLGEDPDALILRTTVVYGPESKGKNFAYRLATTLKAGELIQVPSDQISSPTYNRDLAAATIGLLEQKAKGVWNVTGAEVIDRLELSRRIAEALDLDPSLIEGIDTASLNQKARRPLQAGMNVDKLRAALPDLKLHTVEEAVADWLANPRGKAWPSG